MFACIFGCVRAWGNSATPLTLHIVLLFDRDPAGYWIRRDGPAEAGRFLCGGMEGAAEIDDPDRAGTAAELHDADHGVFDVMWPLIAHRIPALEELKVVNQWAGFYDYNIFDQNALLGHVPGFENMLVATGFSGHGIQQAPAVGRGIAELVLHGEYQSLDLSRLAASRVGTGSKVLEQCVV